MDFINEFTDKDKMFIKEIKCNIKLKNHQLTLLNACIEHENNGISIENDDRINNRFLNVKTNIGIIGDKVGSGKSFVVLSIILCNPQPLVSYNYTYTYGNNHLLFETKPIKYEKELDLNMIVCSYGLIKQWEKYIQLFSDELTYFLMTSTANFEKYKLINDEKKFSIMLVSANFYKVITNYFTERRFRLNRVFFDEVDTVSIPMAKQINSKFYWLVSASYRNILYPYPKWNYGYLKSYMISSGIQGNAFIKNIFAQFSKCLNEEEKICLSKIILKNEDSYVDESFNLPEIRKTIYVCKTPIEFHILDGITSLNILKSLHAGDVETAIQCLNQGNVNKEEHIIGIVKQDTENKIKNTKIKIESTKNMVFGNENIQKNKISFLETELLKLEEKLNLLCERITESHLCNICYEPHKNKSITKCCKNSFCLECICFWLNNNQSCPFCKNYLNVNELYIVNDNIQSSCEELNKFEKLEMLLKELLKTSKRKILIFSNYDITFQNISIILEKNNLSYDYLKGIGINNIINKYKHTNDNNILLVNTKAYGCGLNLENTTDIIMFHKFDSQDEKQIIGRAQRPGRIAPLSLWYLLHANEKM
jgi:SNF2 family DNA or RNA helicase